MSEFLGFKSYPVPYFCPYCEETYEEDDKVYHEHCEDDEGNKVYHEHCEDDEDKKNPGQERD